MSGFVVAITEMVSDRVRRVGVDLRSGATSPIGTRAMPRATSSESLAAQVPC